MTLDSDALQVKEESEDHSGEKEEVMPEQTGKKRKEHAAQAAQDLQVRCARQGIGPRDEKGILHQGLVAGTCHQSSGGRCAWRCLLPAACCAHAFSARHSTLVCAGCVHTITSLRLPALFLFLNMHLTWRAG